MRRFLAGLLLGLALVVVVFATAFTYFWEFNEFLYYQF